MDKNHLKPRPFCCWFFGRVADVETGERACFHPACYDVFEGLAPPKLPEDERQPFWCPMRVIPIEKVRQVLDAKEKAKCNK